MNARSSGVKRNASALLIVAVLVAGCSGRGGSEGSGDEAASATGVVTPAPAVARASASVSQASATDPVGEAVADPEETAAAPPAAQAVPLATAAGDLPGLTLEIIALRRSAGDDSVTLEFALRNDGEADFEPGYDLGYGANNIADSGAVGGVYLIDVAEAKKYLVLRDAEGACLCSSGFSVPAGQRTPLFATFPPVPAETGALTVTVPHFLPVDDVPVGE